MKQFYNIFSNPKVSTLWIQLTWSHLRLLFNLEIDSIDYYIKVTIDKHLSVRELEFKIKSNEYNNENDNINVIYTELNGYKFMFMSNASTITEHEVLNKYNFI